jgi:hypothetical protein
VTILPLVGALLVSCKQSQDYPPLISQVYEAGSMGGSGGGGGGGSSLSSSTCVCPGPTAVDGGDGDEARSTCYVDGFQANATSFALPTVVGAVGASGGPPLTSLEGSDHCSVGKTASWSVIDMNGDDKPDFVLTEDCSDSAIGNSSWDVYFNTGTGFSATATSFALPTVAGALGASGGPPLTSLEGSDACSVGRTASWSVVDMNGDDKPDFVLTEACSDLAIGNSSWDVYFNTGTGFSAMATSFALPTIVGALGASGGPPLTSLGGSDPCSVGETARWSVSDMNGDKKPDFLVTRACADATIGNSSWDVYRNSGTGFSSKATSFALPTVYGALGASGAPALPSLDGSDPCSLSGSASWSVIDVNGDYKPDFLLTRACTDSAVGTSRWDVYLNTGTGFSTNATSFALPTIVGALGASGVPPLTSLGGSDECARGGTASWSVLDMNGDREPDFLLTRACADSTIGNSGWSVYLARCGP